MAETIGYVFLGLHFTLNYSSNNKIKQKTLCLGDLALKQIRKL
jgi:hypothetical protein